MPPCVKGTSTIAVSNAPQDTRIPVSFRIRLDRARAGADPARQRRRTRDERPRQAARSPQAARPRETVRARHDRNGVPDDRARHRLLGGLLLARCETAWRRDGGQTHARREGASRKAWPSSTRRDVSTSRWRRWCSSPNTKRSSPMTSARSPRVGSRRLGRRPRSALPRGLLGVRARSALPRGSARSAGEVGATAGSARSAGEVALPQGA